MSNEFTILAGTANPAWAAAIAREPVQVNACTLDWFPDAEVAVQLLPSVRRKEVFLVQPISSPVDMHLIELIGRSALV